MNNINDVLVFLSENKKSNIAQHIESSFVRRYKNKMEWKKLTSDAKQAKRKSVLKACKKYYEEDGLATYTYENALIGFYDACQQLIKELSTYPKDNLLIIRLTLLITIDMESIDSDSNFFNKKIIPSNVYEGLFRELEEAQITLEGSILLLKNVKILSPFDSSLIK